MRSSPAAAPCEPAKLAPGGVGEVLVELLGEVPGEVLALPAATSQLPTPPVTVNERHHE